MGYSARRGFTNGKGIENNMSVKGSQATAVGSRNNLYYLPQPIIGAKMQELSEQFGLQMEMSKQDSINAMEDILCDEYAKEFAFEGIRFYDLQRILQRLSVILFTTKLFPLHKYYIIGFFIFHIAIFR